MPPEELFEATAVAVEATNTTMVVGTIYTTVQYVPIFAEAARSVSASIPMPPDAIVEAASVQLTASPAGRTTIADVARVRAAQGSPTASGYEIVVDFGGLRTVSQLSVPREQVGHVPLPISGIAPWVGTEFGDDLDLTADLLVGGAVDSRTFREVLTERLLVKLNQSMDPTTAATGQVTTTTAPADLEVLVAGERVHFVPGPVTGTDASHDETIDIADAVSRALAAGMTEVPLELRSAVPCQLSLTPTHDHLDAHRVRFAEGEFRTLDRAEEGVVDVAVPLGAGSSSWEIRLIDIGIGGDVGDTRVVPSIDPDTESDAMLTCDPDQALFIRLPPAHLHRFETLEAIRILVSCDEATELAGVLHEGVIDPTGLHGPGPAIDDATLEPTAIEVGPSRWVTLPLARPAAVGADDDRWASVVVTRGRVQVPLDEDRPSDADDARAFVRRPAGNDLYRPLPDVPGVSTSAVPIRLAGIPPATAPIDAIDLVVPGTAVSVATTPTSDASRHVHELLEPVSAASPARSGDDLVLRLDLRTGGRITLGPIVVGYQA